MKNQQKKILPRRKFNKYNTLKYKPIICNPIDFQEKEILQEEQKKHSIPQLKIKYQCNKNSPYVKFN